MYFPTSPNGVKWSVLATTDELSDAIIVNYDDTVASDYVPDYEFNLSSGLTIIKATTMADFNEHKLSTSGLYTAACSDGSHFSVKFLVVRK